MGMQVNGYTLEPRCYEYGHRWSLWNRDGEYHDVRTCLRCRRREIKDLITDKVTIVNDKE